MPGLPPTPERLHQARRVAEMGAEEMERVKEVLESCRQPVEPRPHYPESADGMTGAGPAELWELRFRKNSLGANIRIQFW